MAAVPAGCASAGNTSKNSRKAHPGPVVSKNAQQTQINFLARKLAAGESLNEHAQRLYDILKDQVDAALEAVQGVPQTAPEIYSESPPIMKNHKSCMKQAAVPVHLPPFTCQQQKPVAHGAGGRSKKPRARKPQARKQTHNPEK